MLFKTTVYQYLKKNEIYKLLRIFRNAADIEYEQQGMAYIL